VLVGAVLQTHDGTPRRSATPLPAGCFAANRAARALWLSTPLKVPGVGADMALARLALKRARHAQAIVAPHLRATSFAGAPGPGVVLQAAEALIIAAEAGA
jgi:hypothetical protein